MKLHGLIVAAHTPFAADGALNLNIVEQQAEHYAKNGLEIAFVGGSTGESHSLTLDERRQLARRWIEVARGTRLKIVVHVGANCLADARALAGQAEQLGALAIAALAPSYYKPRTLEALIACCAEIAAGAPATPFYFYDIPGMTGVGFAMHDFLAQAPARIPTLAGIKYTNSDLMSYQLCLRAGNGRFDVPYGTDEWLLAALALGAQGAVGSSFNFGGPIYQRLLQAFRAGDLAAARQEQFRSVQLIQLLYRYGYLGAAKAVMRILGVDVGPARLPNDNPSAEQVQELHAQLEALGFFDWL
ncbi:MAG: dihydrodipicolinate synthase family protein [Kiritimatiellaeota bacterium]|nr:dihydrodipicolinate synthase family protein [Kiritimatiellota bacterium]